MQGDREAAERYMRRALEEAKKGFGEDDGHVAAAYNNLAEVFRNSRQFEKAEPLYLEVSLQACSSREEESASMLSCYSGLSPVFQLYLLLRCAYRPTVNTATAPHHPPGLARITKSGLTSSAA